MQRHLINPAGSAIRAGALARKVQALLFGAMVVALVTAMLALVFGLAAAAQSAAKPGATPRQACAADVHTLCAGVLPGGGRIKKCIVEKHDQLSDACKDAMLAARTLNGN